MKAALLALFALAMVMVIVLFDGPKDKRRSRYRGNKETLW